MAQLRSRVSASSQAKRKYQRAVGETAKAADAADAKFSARAAVSESACARDWQRDPPIASSNANITLRQAEAAPSTARLLDPTLQSGTLSTEAASAADAPASTATWPATVTEPAAASDAPASTATWPATDSESAAASDTQSAALSWSAAVSEAGSASDTPDTQSGVVGTAVAELPALSATAAGLVISWTLGGGRRRSRRRVTGTALAKLPALAASAEGTATPPLIIGRAAAILPPLLGDCSGLVRKPARRRGRAVAKLPPLCGAATGICQVRGSGSVSIRCFAQAQAEQWPAEDEVLVLLLAA